MNIVTKTIKVCLHNGWELVCAVNYRTVLNLPEGLKAHLMGVTWSIQDGYGVPGFTPCQGWDWSGIRDSSDEAKKEMALVIISELAKRDIELLQYEDYRC